MAARPTYGASMKDCWERSPSFVHYADPTVVMGVHKCGAPGRGNGKNSFYVVLSEAQMVATITVPVMFPSVPFRGIPTTMFLLPPSVPMKIHLVLKKGVLKNFNSQTHSEKNTLAFSQVLVQKTLLHEVAQTTESRRYI